MGIRPCPRDPAEAVPGNSQDRDERPMPKSIRCMTPFRGQRTHAGLTLLELLCVIAIILVLAGLVMRPAARALQRARADKWAADAEIRLQATVEQLQQHLQGKVDFAPVTLGRIEAEHMVGPLELKFLKDSRVTFTPFAGADPEEKVVIQVELQRGHWTDPGQATETKGAIVQLPK